MKIPLKIKVGSTSIAGMFFTVFLLELFLGGAGRLTTFGPLTLRMYLFISGLFGLGLLLLMGKKITKTTVSLMLIFICVFAIAIVRGFWNSEDFSRIVDDAKMVSFFFILPFFDIMISSYRMADRVVRLLKLCALFMAVAYLIFFVVLNLKLIPYLTIYQAMSKPEYFAEFGFRGEIAMIYKGFVYVAIGYFFYFFSQKSKRNTLKILLVFVAIMLTLVRAYMLLIFGMTFFYIVYRFLVARQNRLLNIVVISSIIIGALAFVPVALEKLGNKSVSDNIRYVQIQQVVEMIDPISFFIGHGYGVGVPIRPGHMEIMYLELFHKQGLLGLAFWLFLLVYIFFKAYNYRIYCENKGHEAFIDTRPFLFGIAFVYLQSVFNPYLTNSMGMTFLFITLVIFEKLKKFHEQKNLGMHGDL
ncbi:O-antigen ligase family protein [Maribacter algicola]|uniref:O-antigen ligase family protein n=1 Tax=Meishania litoralis TaxID=3434685 RepID=A0ACC7LNB1_9FLAO